MTTTDAFLSTTSAHGLPRLRQGSRRRRAVWAFVCVAAYCGLLTWTALLFFQFFDPDDLSTSVSVETLSGTYDEDGDFASDEVFPRPVLCVPEARPADWHLFRRARLGRVSNVHDDEENITYAPFDFRPTLFDAQSAYGLGSDAALGLCASFHESAEYYIIRWNGVQSLDLYITMTNTSHAPVYSFEKKKLTWRDKVVSVRLTEMQTTHFFGSNYTDRFPSEANEGLSFYDENFCLDSCFYKVWRENSSFARHEKARRHYENLATQRQAVLQPDKWREILADVCANATDMVVHFPYHFLCDFRSQECNRAFKKYHSIIPRCQAICKRRHVDERFRLIADSLGDDKIRLNRMEAYVAVNKTELWFHSTSLKRTVLRQKPKMTSVDLLGLVGGYMGLLVGASVVTLCEFAEFFFSKVCGGLKGNEKVGRKGGGS